MSRRDRPRDGARVLLASRAYCHRVARRAGSSFYPCFALLKPPKRAAMEALYAFLRHTDDLADGPQPLDERRRALEAWREVVTAGLGGGGRAESGKRKAENEVLASTSELRFPFSAFPSSLIPALADAVQRFYIPPEHLLAVVDGVQMDLDGRRYETFDELAEYCDRVASAVGLACIHIWGFRGPEALEPARQCGRAFQLTNILRDLGEDAAAGRVYLPLSELRQCGYAPDDLVRGVGDERFERLMAVQIDRARQLYRRGAGLFDLLGPDGRRMFGMMTATYHALLERIARRPGDVLLRRVRLSGWRKVWIAARWILLPPRRSSLP